MVIDSFIWVCFIGFVLFMLVLDLGVFHRKSHEIKIKEALIWSAVWISLALIFNYGIYVFLGKEKAIEFLTGYIVEKSLSVDNLFVFIMLFTYFKVDVKHQHKVLFWGILGALVMRAIFIFAGVALINNFHWIIYIFGALLIFTGIKMLFHKEENIDPDRNPLVKLFKKILTDSIAKNIPTISITNDHTIQDQFIAGLDITINIPAAIIPKDASLILKSTNEYFFNFPKKYITIPKIATTTKANIGYLLSVIKSPGTQE